MDAMKHIRLDCLTFDTAADEYAQFAVPMPKVLDEGMIIAEIIWHHSKTTNNFTISETD